MRIIGDPRARELKISFAKSNVDSIPLNINVATNIFIAISCLFLNKPKNRNKLDIETKMIKKMFITAKKSSIP